ncbi:MAG: diguanylate cyclase [Alphaproteobacteria bacterium]|nr:diguanylate cyclase [Alphaproteobacteria bacterium]
MKILLVERNDEISKSLREAIVNLGHQASVEPMKNNIAGRLHQEHFDVIALNPEPLTTPRPAVLNIRRAAARFVYIFLMSDVRSQREAIQAGTNDLLPLPLQTAQLPVLLGNAQRLINLIQHLGDRSEDFPSAGGIIAKSAFNELFLAGIDRADRYGEKTYVLFITLENYREILNLDGAYAADFAVAKMAKFLTNNRRQSDIVGQTGRAEYAILLRSPLDETEPVEAANRFADAFMREGLSRIMSDGTPSVEIGIKLIALPTGAELAQRQINSLTSK